MGRYIKAGIVGGIVIFIWSMVSWMVLPWHMATVHSFKDEKAVTQMLEANALKPGIYYSPAWNSTQTVNPESVPTVFAAIQFNGKTSMTTPMIISLLTQIVAAIFVAWLLGRTRGLNYFSRVSFVVIFALAAGIVSEVPYWNWFGFDVQYILVAIADLLIGWFFAGLVLAKMVRTPL